MADPKKQEYYRKNRETRLAYQRRYYSRNRSRISHKREIMEDLYPEKAESIKEYQREYFKKHRERIMTKRKETQLRKQGEGTVAP